MFSWQLDSVGVLARWFVDVLYKQALCLFRTASHLNLMSAQLLLGLQRTTTTCLAMASASHSGHLKSAWVVSHQQALFFFFICHLLQGNRSRIWLKNTEKGSIAPFPNQKCNNGRACVWARLPRLLLWKESFIAIDFMCKLYKNRYWPQTSSVKL